MELREDGAIPQDAVVALYAVVGWSAYTREPESLARALANSTYVVTLWEGSRLVGLARCLSDDVALCYIQDILVHPDFQGQGWGRRLLTACLERFAHVRMCVLLTDDEPRQLRFYESVGFTNTRALSDFTLNAFVCFSTRES